MSKYIHVPSSVLDMPVETCNGRVMSQALAVTAEDSSNSNAE